MRREIALRTDLCQTGKCVIRHAGRQTAAGDDELGIGALPPIAEAVDLAFGERCFGQCETELAIRGRVVNDQVLPGLSGDFGRLMSRLLLIEQPGQECSSLGAAGPEGGRLTAQAMNRAGDVDPASTGVAPHRIAACAPVPRAGWCRFCRGRD
jgi:hypothetical protein